MGLELKADKWARGTQWGVRVFRWHLKPWEGTRRELGPRTKLGNIQHSVQIEKIHVTFNGNKIAQSLCISESLRPFQAILMEFIYIIGANYPIILTTTRATTA